MGLVGTVVQQFLANPPIGLITPELIAGGPFAGTQMLQRIRGPINVDAFGLRYIVSSTTPGYGSTTIGGLVRYGRQVITIQVVHELLDGSFLVDQALESQLSTGFLFFSSQLPDHVDVIMAPGVFANLYWLLVL